MSHRLSKGVWLLTVGVMVGLSACSPEVSSRSEACPPARCSVVAASSAEGPLKALAGDELGDIRLHDTAVSSGIRLLTLDVGCATLSIYGKLQAMVLSTKGADVTSTANLCRGREARLVTMINELLIDEPLIRIEPSSVRIRGELNALEFDR